VVPQHKKGSLEELDNYRPISLLPVFSKILEVVLKTRMSLYLEASEILADCQFGQFGFRPNKWTTDAIVSLVNFHLEAFERGEKSRTSFLDMSKAFDWVSHVRLMQKLSCLKFDAPALLLLHSYLKGWLQKVRFGGMLSQPAVTGFGPGPSSVLNLY